MAGSIKPSLASSMKAEGICWHTFVQVKKKQNAGTYSKTNKQLLNVWANKHLQSDFNQAMLS